MTFSERHPFIVVLLDEELGRFSNLECAASHAANRHASVLSVETNVKYSYEECLKIDVRNGRYKPIASYTFRNHNQC